MKVGVIAVMGLVFLSGCKKSVFKDVSGDEDSTSSSLNEKAKANSNPITLPVQCVITSSFPTYWRASTTETVQYQCSHLTGATLSSVECQLDNQAWTACDSANQHGLSGLSQGAHSFRVRARDASNSVGTSLDLLWAVDTVKPTASASAPTMAGTSPTFVFTASDNINGSGIEKTQCRLSQDFTQWEDCTSPKTYPPLTAGTSYEFFVRAIDVAANTGDASDAVDFTPIDSTPNGSCTILSVLPDYLRVKNTVISYRCDSTDPISARECRLNGGAWETCQTATTHPLSNLREGSNVFEVRYLDQNGAPNVPESIAFEVDSIPPTVQITHGDVSTLSPSFNFSGNDGAGSGIDGYQCILNQGAPPSWPADCTPNCASPKTYSSGVLPGLAYAFHVRACDVAGNASTASAKYDWVSNPGDGPSCVILTTFDPDAFRNNASETISYNCSSADPNLTRQCRVNGGTWDDCKGGTNQYTITGLTSGNYTFEVKATDSFGNAGDPSAPLEWKVDRNKPTVSIFLTEVDSPQARISFIETDTGGSGIDSSECQLVGVDANYYPCFSPETLNGLVTGNSYTFRVRTKDGAGNVSDPVQTTFTATTTYVGPSCLLAEIGGPFPEWTNQAERTFNISCTGPKPVARTRCSSQGTGEGDCTSPVTTRAYVSGTKVFSAWGIDADGVAGPADSKTWKVDLNAPTVQVNDLSFLPGPSGKVQLTFDASDTGGSGVGVTECKLDGVTQWSSCTSPVQYASGRAMGATYIFRVRARDTAGNVSGEGVRTWTNGDWSPWSACQAACGKSGLKTHTCTNPAPSGGGLGCGDPVPAPCTRTCPNAVNGGWSYYQKCSTANDCGGYATITCIQPKENYTGSTCSAGQKQYKICREEHDKKLTVAQGQTKSITIKCGSNYGLYWYKYTGTKTLRCSWDTDEDEAKLTCTNPRGSGDTFDADHVMTKCCFHPDR